MRNLIIPKGYICFWMTIVSFLKFFQSICSSENGFPEKLLPRRISDHFRIKQAVSLNQQMNRESMLPVIKLFVVLLSNDFPLFPLNYSNNHKLVYSVLIINSHCLFNNSNGNQEIRLKFTTLNSEHSSTLEASLSLLFESSIAQVLRPPSQK